MAIQLNIDKSVFLPVYRPYIFDYQNRYNIYYGGRGSGKTHFLLTKLLIKGLQEKRTILLMRKVYRKCKDSVWAELKSAMDRLKVRQFFDLYEGEYRAVCKLNGTVFKCEGLDLAEKIKGYSEVSDCLMEEATEFTLEDFELIDGTIRSVKYKLPLQLYLSFNPVSKQNYVFKRFGFDTGIVPPNTFILKTTYLDNKYLSQDYLDRMEHMKQTNPTRWKIEALGDFVSLDRLIFQNYKVEEFDYSTIQGQLLVGLDFGFQTDPSAIVASILNEEEKTIHIFREWSGQGKTNQELIEVIKALGFSKSVIIADSAEMKSIEEIKRGGIIKIKPATKGPDSVRFGIQKLLNYTIIVHPDCQGVITEFENYAWKRDRNGEYTNEPIDNFNHFMDSLRYSTQAAANKLKTLSKDLF
jgi:phage terminase large subunit